MPQSIVLILYRIAGNFRGVLIFVIFVTAVATSIKYHYSLRKHERNFATVGKGRHAKSRRARDRALYQASPPC